MIPIVLNKHTNSTAYYQTRQSIYPYPFYPKSAKMSQSGWLYVR